MSPVSRTSRSGMKEASSTLAVEFGILPLSLRMLSCEDHSDNSDQPIAQTAVIVVK